jgi:hypothetical protein
MSKKYQVTLRKLEKGWCHDGKNFYALLWKDGDSVKLTLELHDTDSDNLAYTTKPASACDVPSCRGPVRGMVLGKSYCGLHLGQAALGKVPA